MCTYRQMPNADSKRQRRGRGSRRERQIANMIKEKSGFERANGCLLAERWSRVGLETGWSVHIHSTVKRR